MNRGHIHLWRKITDSDLWPKGRRFTPFEAWIDMVLNLAQGKDNGDLKRGELQVSVTFLAKRWLWDRSTVSRFLKKQAKNGRISIEQTPQRVAQRVAQRITICKYELYNAPTQRVAQRVAQPIKQSIKTKGNKKSKKSAGQTADARYQPLIDFFFQAYKKQHGKDLITNASDFKAVKDLLTKTKTKPEYTVRALQWAALRFLRDPSDFYRKQGHPLRYWATNINSFFEPEEKGGDDWLSKY